MGTKFFDDSKEKKQTTMTSELRQGDMRLAHLNNQQQANPTKAYKMHENYSLTQSIEGESSKLQAARESFAADISQRGHWITKKWSISGGKKNIAKLEAEDKQEREEFFGAQKEMALHMNDAIEEKREEKAQNNSQQRYEVELDAGEIWSVMEGALSKAHKTDVKRGKKKHKEQLSYRELWNEESLLSSAGKSKRNLKNPNQEEQKQVDALKHLKSVMNLAAQLNTATNNGKDMTEQEIQNFIGVYKNLNLETFPFSAMYLGDELKKMPKEAKIILYHCVYSAVRDSMDNLNRENVELNQAGDILGFVEALDQAAQELIQSDGFLKKYNDQKKAIRDKMDMNNLSKEQQDWLAAEDIREKGIAGTEADKEEAVKQAIAVYCGKEFKRKDMANVAWIEGDDYKEYLFDLAKEVLLREEAQSWTYFTKEVILRRLHFISERLNQRMLEVWQCVASEEELHHNVPTLMAEVCKYIVKKNRNLVKERNGIQPSALKNTFDALKKVIGPNAQNQDEMDKKIARYHVRHEKIAQAFGINRNGQEDMEKWQSPEIRNLLLRMPDTENGETEEDAQKKLLKELEAIKGQREANEQRLQAFAEEAFSNLYRQEYLDLLKRKLGIRIALSAPAPLMVAVSEIYRNLAANDVALATKNAFLLEDMKKAGIKPAWFRQAAEYLSEQIRSAGGQNAPKYDNPTSSAERASRVAALKSFLRSAKGNIEHFEKQMKDKKFTEKQWKALIQWKNQNVTAANFQRELTSQIPQSAAQDQPGAMSINEYLYQKDRQMFSVQEKLVEEIKGDKLINSRELQNFIAKDGDAVLRLFEEMLHNKRLKEVERFKRYEELHKIDSIGELGALPYGLYEQVVGYIKENLEDAAREWGEKQQELQDKENRLNNETTQRKNNRSILEDAKRDLESERNGKTSQLHLKEDEKQRLEGNAARTDDENTQLENLRNEVAALQQKIQDLNGKIAGKDTEIQENEKAILKNEKALTEIPSQERKTEIKKMLLAKMFRGELRDKAAMDEAFDAANMHLYQMNEIQEKGFKYQLVKDIDGIGKVNYAVGEGVRSKAGEYKALKRNINFRYAEKAWEGIHPDQHILVVKVFAQFMADFKEKYYDKTEEKWRLAPVALKEKYEKKTTEIVERIQKNKSKPKGSQISDNDWRDFGNILRGLDVKEEMDSSKSVALPSYIREMMMLRTEEFAFSTGSVGNQEFLYGNDEQYFNKMLEITTQVSERAKEILTRIQNPDDQKKLLLNMREMMVSMKKGQLTDVEKKAYQERFGAESWENAIDKADTILNDPAKKSGLHSEKALFDSMKLDLSKMVLQIGDQANLPQGNHRVQYDTKNKLLDGYMNKQKRNKLVSDGGVKIFEKAAFKELIPYIMRNNKYWNDLAQKSGNQAEFYAYLGSLVNKISEPLLLLTDAVGEYPLLAKQFVDTYHKEILAGIVPASMASWKECVNLFVKKNFGQKIVSQGYRKGRYKSKQDNIWEVKEKLPKKGAENIIDHLQTMLEKDPAMEEYFYDKEKLLSLAKRLALKHEQLQKEINAKVDTWINDINNQDEIRNRMAMVYGKPIDDGRWREIKENWQQIVSMELYKEINTLNFDALDGYVQRADLNRFKKMLVYKSDDITKQQQNQPHLEQSVQEQQREIFDEQKLVENVKTAEKNILDEKTKGAEAYYNTSHAEISEDMRQKSLAFGSVIIAKWAGQDAKADFKQDDIEKARKEIKEVYGHLPSFVQECLVERWLALKINNIGGKDRHKTISKDALLLTQAYAKVKELAASDDGQQMSEEYINRFLLFLYTSDNVLDTNASKKTLATGLEDSDYEAAFETFLKMLAIIDEIDIKQDDPALLKEEKREFKEFAMFSVFMKHTTDLQTYVDEKKAYFNHLKTALVGFENAIEEINRTSNSKIEKREKVHLLTSLREYFLFDIVTNAAKTSDEYKTSAETLLRSKENRTFLFLSQSMDTRGRNVYREQEQKEQYHRELFQVREKDLVDDLNGIREENKRAEVEDALDELYMEIYNSWNPFENYEPLLTIYHKLKSDEKTLFFMILEACEKTSAIDSLASAQLVRDESLSFDQKVTDMQKNIENFIKKENFAPQIHFDVVEKKLFFQKGEVNWDNFEMAMEITRVCIKQRSEEEGNDWEKMANATSSIQNAMLLTDSTDLVINLEKYKDEKIESAQQLKDRIMDILLQEDDKEAQDIREKFWSVMNKEDIMRYLIIGLQNRTYMDKSTAVGFFGAYKGYQIEHADEDGRNNLKAEMLKEGPSSNMSGWMAKADSATFCTKAFLSLLSFQLKDDVDLRNRNLNKKDFVNLKRKTVFDLGLLKEAISFAKEVASEKNRLDALRQAPELIKKSGNKNAEDALEKYQGNVTDEQSFLKFLTLQSISDKKMSEKEKESAVISLASYHSFTDAEKELFVSVLQHRDLLDVSQKGYGASLVGFAERDYVNAEGRNALMDEYLANSYRSKGRVRVSAGAYEKAFKVVLSRQLNDDVDFSQTTTDDLKFVDSRKSAVDWKLISRAVQFVKRTTDEEIIRKQDEALYYATGDVEKHGGFEKGGDYMRKNLRRAGNFATRGLARYLKNKGKSWMPGTLKAVLFAVSTAASRTNQFNYIMNDGEVKRKPEVKALGLRGGIQFFNEAISANDTAREYMRSDLEEKTAKEIKNQKTKEDILDNEAKKYRNEKLHDIRDSKAVEVLKGVGEVLNNPIKAFHNIKEMDKEYKQENQDAKEKYESAGIVSDPIKVVTIVTESMQEVENIVDNLTELYDKVDQKLTAGEKAKAIAKNLATNVDLYENVGNVVIKTIEGVGVGANLIKKIENAVGVTKPEETKAEELKAEEPKAEETKPEGTDKKERKEVELTTKEIIEDVVAIGKEIKETYEEIKSLISEESKWDTEEEKDTNPLNKVNTAGKFMEGGMKIAEGIGNVMDRKLVKEKIVDVMDIKYDYEDPDTKEITGEVVGRQSAGVALDVIKFGRKIIKVTRQVVNRKHDMNMLHEAEKKGKKHIKEDARKRYQAGQKLKLSMEQKERLEKAYERNARAQEAAGYGANRRGRMDISAAVIEAIAMSGDTVLGTEKLGVVEKLTQDAMILVKALAQRSFDYRMAKRYFDIHKSKGDTKQMEQIRGNYKGGIKRFRDDLKNPLPQGQVRSVLDSDLEDALNATDKFDNIDSVDGFKLMQGIYGFQSEDEFVAYSGLSMIHSLLYSASKFGESMKSNHIIAIAVLKFLDLGDCIGKLDSETAIKVQTALRGKKFS